MYEGIAEAIDKIVEISKPEFHTKKWAEDGPEITFANQQMYLIDDKPALPATLQVTTLQAVVDLLSDGNSFTIDEHIVHVISPTEVEVIGRDLDEYNRRPIFVVARMRDQERKFPFGNWLKQEDFIIGLMACFVDSPDLQEIIKTASSLASEDRLTVEDTGIAQNVTAKQGISLQQTIPVKPRRRLTPYRTFREADQVESDFILRIKKLPDGFPALALFEADGGAWRSIAAHNVAEWLRAELPTAYMVVE